MNKVKLWYIFKRMCWNGLIGISMFFSATVGMIIILMLVGALFNSIFKYFPKDNIEFWWFSNLLVGIPGSMLLGFIGLLIYSLYEDSRKELVKEKGRKRK